MSSCKSMFNNETILLNDESLNYNKIFNHFSLIAKNRFEWKNLPPGIESRHIENGLFKNGQVAFVRDGEVNYICLPCNPQNAQNIYGDPNAYTLTGVGFSKQYKSNDLVRILNNDNGTSDIHIVHYYAEVINEIERTSIINLKQQRTPYIVSTTKNNELSLKNILKKMLKGEFAIMVDEKFSNGGNVGINTLQTNSPFLLDKLQQHKNDLMSELYSFLGLNNKNTDKKERLLVDEVNVNNSQILMNLEIAYKNRLKACEEINKKFNLSITVEKVIDKLEVSFIGDEQDQKDDKIINTEKGD